jgi:pimeloyl-ACP methyl ester carboxylesterase
MITMKLTTIAPQRMLSAVVGGMGWIPQGSTVEERKSGGLLGPSLRACAQAFPQLGITKDELMALKVPMVIVIGKDDGLLARRVNPLREVRPDIPVVEIAGASHLTCVFRPEFRKAIQEFLDKQLTPVH